MAKAKILIVDDDPDIVEAMRLPLEANDYEVVTAANGGEGLQRVKEEEPELIILDVMMESDTAGFQFSYQLRNPDPKSEYAQYAKIPILMLTGIGIRRGMSFSPEADRDFLPVDDYVEKPVQPSVLLKRIEELLTKE